MASTKKALVEDVMDDVRGLVRESVDHWEAQVEDAHAEPEPLGPDEDPVEAGLYALAIETRSREYWGSNEQVAVTAPDGSLRALAWVDQHGVPQSTPNGHPAMWLREDGTAALMGRFENGQREGAWVALDRTGTFAVERTDYQAGIPGPTAQRSQPGGSWVYDESPVRQPSAPFTGAGPEPAPRGPSM